MKGLREICKLLSLQEWGTSLIIVLLIVSGLLINSYWISAAVDRNTVAINEFSKELRQTREQSQVNFDAILRIQRALNLEPSDAK